MQEYKLYHFKKIDNTINQAKKLIEQSVSFPAIVIADEQEKGKGKGSRVWFSPKGNLYFSLVKPLHREKISNLQQLSFITALTIAQILHDLGVEKSDIQFKWPNDVLLKGKKVSGILLENYTNEAGEEFLIISIGINILKYPDHVLFPATCIKDHVHFKLDFNDFLSLFYNLFDISYIEWIENGFIAFKQQWLKQAYKLNEKIVIYENRDKEEVIFRGLDDYGALLVETVQGKVKSVYSADIMESIVRS